MAQPTNLVLENQLLNDEIKRRLNQIQALNTVAATIGHSLDLNKTLNTAMEAVLELVDAEASGISLIDEVAQEVVLRAQIGWVNDFVEENPMRIPLGKGMSGEVINNDEVVFYNDLSGDENYAVSSFKKEQFRSIIMAPMHASGEIIGIISVMSSKPHQFDDLTVTMVSSIADTVAVAIENARLHEQHVEHENRLNAILHSTADGILATDRDGRVRVCNYAAAIMLDVESQKIVGTPLREVNIQYKVLDQLLLAMMPENKDEEIQSFQVQVEGGRTISVLISPVQAPSQVSRDIPLDDGWVVVLQDITHLREAEIARVQFIQAAAHDMKNPLSVTQKSISMLDTMLPSDDEMIAEVIQMASSGVGRVQRLIDDLLNIEKIESGYQFKLDDVDVREMLYEINAQVKPLMQSRNINYTMIINDDVPVSIRLDREWMQRALHNYLENASKYAPDGAVDFKVYAMNGNLYSEVVDSGSGIPLQAQARLFDRFYRVDSLRKDVSGSGLGLAIVKSVAEAHGGMVYVRSKEGEGSTFGIRIPIS
ncbi:MAG: ATP-binding protein [Chloroflexota bacterium]